MADDHTHDHVTQEEYEGIVRKMATVEKRRSPREDEVEKALDCSVPGLLSDLLDANSGSKRAARMDLNDRLDEAGVSTDVSSSTFYDWLEKYHLE